MTAHALLCIHIFGTDFMRTRAYCEKPSRATTFLSHTLSCVHPKAHCRPKIRRTCVQEAAGQVAALEERYWHAFNDLSLQLGTHLQDRDATLAKVQPCSRRLICLE